MRLWWAAGTGSGPVAVIELSRPDGEAIHVPVSGVTHEVCAGTHLSATVRGPVGPGAALRIEVGGAEFQPVGPAFTRN